MKFKTEVKNENIRKISIIIPTYNSEQHIENCLKSIKYNSINKSLFLEIIVIDGGSEDKTLDIVREYTKIIVSEPKVTRGEARNVGARLATNDILVFLDSDCEVTSNWMHFIETLNSFDDMIVGPVILADVKGFLPNSIRILLTNPIFTFGSKTFSTSNERIEDVNEAPASNILISKNLFFKIGGFPDLNFNEDTIFSNNVARAHKIIYEPNFKCIHHKHYDSVIDFSKYFFNYGKYYSQLFKSDIRSYLRRYASASLFIGFLIFISVIGLLYNFINLYTILIFFVIYYILIYLYSFIKYDYSYALILPILFILLIFSYVGGFWYGLFI